MGRVPWEFIAVTEQDLLEKLSRSKPHGSRFLKGAPLGVVVCADPQKCDVWIEDVSVASTFLLLAAHDMGLGACWIQIRERMHSENMSAEAYIAQVLSIPPNLKVESIIAIGYPDEQKPLRKRDTLQFEKVHCDMYGRPFA